MSQAVGFSKPLKWFSVVYFPLENRYCVIPSTWLNENRAVCFWPGPKTKNPSTLIKCATSVPEDGWKKFKIEFIKSYDSYDKAENKAELLKQSQNLELVDTSENEIGGQRQVEEENIQRPITPPGFATLPLVNLDYSTSSAFEAEQSSISLDHTGGNVIIVPDPAVQKLKEEFDRFVEKSVKNQEAILSELNDIKLQLRDALRLQNLTPFPNNHRYPPLPLKTVEEMNDAEKIIDDQQQFAELVNELKRVGGSNVGKSVYNCMRRLISKPLAQCVRFTDNSGKLSFGAVKLADACRGAVRSIWDEKAASDAIVNDYIAKYFRNSAERKQGENGNAKKNKTTANSQSGIGIVTTDSTNFEQFNPSN